MPLPELSPLIATDLICRTCGDKMKRTILKDKQNRAHKIYYTCEFCNYHTESDQMHNGRQFNGPAPAKGE